MQLDGFEIPQPHVREEDIPLIRTPEGCIERAPVQPFFRTANIFLSLLKPVTQQAADTDELGTRLHFFLVHDPRRQIAINATPREVQHIQECQQSQLPFIPKHYLPGLSRTGPWPHKTLSYHAVLGVQFNIPVGRSTSPDIYRAQNLLRQYIIQTNAISKEAERLAREGITEKLAAPYLTQNPSISIMRRTSTDRAERFLQTIPYYAFLLS